MGRRRKIEPIRKEDANKKDPGERRGSYQGGREGDLLKTTPRILTFHGVS